MSVALKEVRKSGLRAHAIGRVAKAVVESLESRTLLSSTGLNAWAAPLAVAPAGPVITPAAVTITIADADLEAAVRSALGKPTGDITDEDMATLTSLDASVSQVGAPIGELTGLETAVNLQTLDVSGNNIGDVTPLAGLTSLTTLNLSGNRITDVSSLGGLTALTTVDVSNNDIDVTAGSASMNVIQGWIDQGAAVTYLPQGGGPVTNEAPTDIALSNDTVAAGLPPGTVVGTFSTTDPNDGDTFTYALVDGAGATDNASFIVVGDELRTADTLSAGSYSILVETTDQGGLSTQKIFAVTVAVPGANEAPTDIALSDTTIATGQPAGTVVGTFSTTDPNAGDTFTYTLVDGAGATDNASFVIVDNELRTADALSAGSYSILVQTTDQGGMSTQKNFTVTVAVPGANEAPTDIALSDDTIATGLPEGTVVGTFSTTDPNAGDTFTYTLVDGAGGEDNASFTIVGDQLQTAASLGAGSYSILVQTTDQDGLSTQKNFTVTVTSGDGNLLGVFGMTGGKKAQSLSLFDLDGDKVTFTLTGGGTGQLLGADGAFDQIVLTGTTSKSVLTVKVKKATGGDGEVTISGLTSDGLMKSIKAAPVIVAGPVDLNTANQPAGKTSVALQFDQLRDASVTSEGLPISSLKVLNWGTPDTLTAPSVGTITVSGRKEKPRTLAVEFLPGDLDASVTTAGAIKSIKAAGSITGDIRSGQDAKGKGIGSITAGRSLTGATIATSGSINTIKVGALLGSDILVGVMPDFDGRFAGAAGDFVNPTAKLGNLNVKGAKLAKGVSHPAYVIDSNISAPNVGTITLLNVAADTGPMVYVLNDKGTLKIKQTKLVSESVVASGTFKAPKTHSPLWVVVTPAV